MITKQQLEEHLTPEPINDYSYIRFVSDLKNTESYALEKFKREKIIHKDIRYLKIVLNGEYPKEFIKEAVNNYRKFWKNVTFGIIDKTPGSYEPTQKWIIRIDTKE
jgi:hypothetical protein